MAALQSEHNFVGEVRVLGINLAIKVCWVILWPNLRFFVPNILLKMPKDITKCWFSNMLCQFQSGVLNRGHLTANSKASFASPSPGCFLPYCLPAPFRSSVSPLRVETQSPLIAAGHRSLCPWRRQPTYCQLVLKWKTFHHPTENTIKNTCTSGRPSRATLCHKFSYTESASPSQIFTFPVTECLSARLTSVLFLVHLRRWKNKRKWTSAQCLTLFFLRDICRLVASTVSW